MVASAHTCQQLSACDECANRRLFTSSSESPQVSLALAPPFLAHFRSFPFSSLCSSLRYLRHAIQTRNIIVSTNKHLRVSTMLRCRSWASFVTARRARWLGTRRLGA
jgi:hypothetical protein